MLYNQPRSLITDVLHSPVWEEHRNEVLITNVTLYTDASSLKENLLVKLFDELWQKLPELLLFFLRKKEK